jgi:hypothetical protein
MPHTYISFAPLRAPASRVSPGAWTRSGRSPMAGGRVLQSADAPRGHRLARTQREPSAFRPRPRRKRGGQPQPDSGLDSRPVQPMVTNAASRRPRFNASDGIAPDWIAGRRSGAPPRPGRHGMRAHESDDARAGASSCRALPDHPGAPAPSGQAGRIPARSRDPDHALRSGQHGAPHVVGAPGRPPSGCLGTPVAGRSGIGVRPRHQRTLDPTDARLDLQGAGELPPGCRPAGRDPLGADGRRAIPRASNAPAAPPAGAGARGPLG